MSLGEGDFLLPGEGLFLFELTPGSPNISIDDPAFASPGSVRVAENFSDSSPKLFFFKAGVKEESSESYLSSSSVKTF